MSLFGLLPNYDIRHVYMSSQNMYLQAIHFYKSLTSSPLILSFNHHQQPKEKARSFGK